VSDTPSREGSRLGPYLLGALHPDSDPALGRIHEAHHVDTGAVACVEDRADTAAFLFRPPSLPSRPRSHRRALGYPLPSTPIKGQQKPPCLEGTSVEINGGCWVTLEQRAPCPRSTAEHQGKCYMPVRDPPPEPRSLQP